MKQSNRQSLDLITQFKIAAERKDATINAIANLSAVFSIVLHDKFGWGPERINRLLNNVVNQCDCCNAGTVKMDEIFQWAIDYGINIEVKRKA